jgi:hypothetical protein
MAGYNKQDLEERRSFLKFSLIQEVCGNCLTAEGHGMNGTSKYLRDVETSSLISTSFCTRQILNSLRTLL